MTAPVQTETLQSALARAIVTLEQPGSLLAMQSDADRRREAESLLLAALGLPRSMLYRDPDHRLQSTESARVSAWLNRRRQGVPLAYLVGHREFWSLDLEVTPDVLIPRPETEHLVELALQRGSTLVAQRDRPLRLLELGTGSGAIALALRQERPDWSIVATDVSAAALAVAQKNAQRLGIFDIDFLAGDWFLPVEHLVFDLILSNPPYVAADDPCLAGDSLRYEPPLALTPGKDALEDLRHIIRSAKTHLHPDGWLLLEHGNTQAQAVRAELLASGYTDVRSHTDLAGHGRNSEGRLRY
jgi:release factor glutamine methyltransferase